MKAYLCGGIPPCANSQNRSESLNLTRVSRAPLLWALVCMTGVSGCQTGNMHDSLPDTPTEAFLIIPVLVLGGVAWAIQSTGDHLHSSVTVEPKERVLTAYEFSELRSAAKRGDPLAQNDFGVCHSIGQAVVQDRRLAVYWYRLSADQGFAPAQANLARCYATAEGVWRDETEAYAYASLAGLSQPGMSELVAGLSPSHVIDGKKRAAELGKELFVRLAKKQAKDSLK